MPVTKRKTPTPPIQPGEEGVREEIDQIAELGGAEAEEDEARDDGGHGVGGDDCCAEGGGVGGACLCCQDCKHWG